MNAVEGVALFAATADGETKVEFANTFLQAPGPGNYKKRSQKKDLDPVK